MVRNIKNYTELFENLDSSNPSKRVREDFKSALKQLALDMEASPDNSSVIAYEITGFMATKYAQSLEDGSPIDEVLTIAGELETNPDNSDTLRHELIDKISTL
ncbi:MAG: hypothetical protein L0H36_02540 [bacterium]|nr:hypothetical protein [bacterium]